MSEPEPARFQKARNDYWKMSGTEGAYEIMQDEQEKMVKSAGLAGLIANYEDIDVWYSRDLGPHETGFDNGSGTITLEAPNGIEVTVNADAEYLEEPDVTVLRLQHGDEVYSRVLNGRKNYGPLKHELRDMSTEVTDIDSRTNNIFC